MNHEPLTFVLFGATGDLAQRKIVPALASLFEKGVFPTEFQIICYSRRPWTDMQYHEFIAPSLARFSAETVTAFFSHLEYAQGTFDNEESFKNLQERIAHKNIFCHLAVQPEFYAQIAHGLGHAGIHAKLLIEKPFGHNLASAEKLEDDIEIYFPSEDIFRIDHYLGKGGLDAVIARRIQDAGFEQKLHKDTVASIHCRILEALDIGDRGEFYDTVGALRDVGQNHVLEMLASVLMDITTEDVSLARAIAFEQLEPVPEKNMLHGQYEGYLQTTDVRPDSHTETYFSITTTSTNPRFDGVAIILEGGKAFAEKKSDITITYRDGTTVVFDIETPKNPDAYEVCIAAAIKHDTTRFVSWREMKALWMFVTPILESFKHIPLVSYKKGSESVR